MLRKKQIIMVGMALMLGAMISGCDAKESTVESVAVDLGVETIEEATEDVSTESDSEEMDSEETSEVVDTQTEVVCPLADGIYEAEFDTDSSMFHVNESMNGMGTLTVEDGKMMIHISLVSKKILNLYPGLAEDAAKEGANILEPTVDNVTYSDGYTEEVFGFDVPVPYLEEEFDLAVVGEKGTWYDHKVTVSNPVSKDGADRENAQADENVEELLVADGTYLAELDFEGGSGKAYIVSPATIIISEGKMIARVEWSSPNYDYMLVDGEKYLPVNTEGNSVFEIPVSALDMPINVIGDTVAMSKPHEIEYVLTFHASSLTEVE